MLRTNPDWDILGVRVRRLGFGQALADLEAGVAEDGQRVVHFLNANNANIAQNNQTYRQVLSRVEVLPDGIGVDIAARMLYGHKFPSNLNGTDLVPAFFVHVTRPLKVAMIGGTRAALERAAIAFGRSTPWHLFEPIADGYFDPEETEAVLDRLSAFDPDVTLVAMGSPKQELWIDQHIRPGHGRLVIGVGALFDFVSGRVSRAPALIRDLRLEWCYRLLMEPARLWRRYIVGNPLFVYRVLQARKRGGRPTAAAH